MLHLVLKVREVKENPNDPEHIDLYAIIEAPKDKGKTGKTDRIMQIGLPDKNPMRDIGQGIQQSLIESGFIQAQRRPPVAGVALYITQQQYIQLGRPTVNDIISLDGRVLIGKGKNNGRNPSVS
jgi:hypothetical protein